MYPQALLSQRFRLTVVAIMRLSHEIALELIQSHGHRGIPTVPPTYLILTCLLMRDLFGMEITVIKASKLIHAQVLVATNICHSI